jgi:NADPH:quinone reductase-like Zn-dependent oxidoreductase
LYREPRRPGAAGGVGLRHAGAGRAITSTIGGRYALADAATAHRDLEARRTQGSIVFTL